MFMSCEASLPVVAGAMPSTTSKSPACGRIDSTVATTSFSTRSSPIAAIGISTLCSAASASARTRLSDSEAVIR